MVNDTSHSNGAPENGGSILFSPYRLGAATLPNRIVMAPMTRSRTGEERTPGTMQAEYYRQRAGAGLIVTEATQVSPRGIGYPATPGISRDEQVEGWKKVTDAVHEAGGRVFLQLFHVGRISHPSMQPDGELPVAPSAVRADGELYTGNGMKPFPTPRALDADEIPGVVEEFVQAARNAQRAGFDGIEIHGANGYLIDQFLRDRTNRRDDEWGGSIANRARFALAVVDGVAGVWGADRVGFRISPQGSFNDMADSDPRALFAHLARELSKRRLAYLHLVEPVGEAGGSAEPPAERLGPALRDAFDGTLIVNGGYDFAEGERAVASGLADLVAYGVPFIANPDLPERFRRGAELNEADPSTFYGGGVEGYLDYPTL